MSRGQSSTRLHVLLARRAPVAVVLRRGPSKQVLLVRWDLTNDSFEAGQWLKGRLYERRCDLSPRGERFIYFAANYGAPLRTWTAVSRPPYLTAVAIWPKGDAWGGGGLMPTENQILLNHPSSAMALQDGVRLPRKVHVSPLPYAGGGEDSPIFDERMSRDGWTLVEEGRWSEPSITAGIWLTCDPPETWVKHHPDRSISVRLRMRTLGIKERQGPWYMTHYDVLDRAGVVKRDLGRADWADWDSNGDLLFARDGKLHRMPRARAGRFALDSKVATLIDLAPLKFEPRAPVQEAMSWRGPRPRGVPLPSNRPSPK
jgi:hypothetical protein